ncbi:MAG: DUF2062 domain-containing protein [Alphaproteobacteria bacterium]
MFKRRTPLNVFQKLKELAWPSMGWGRMGVYLKHRTIRIPDSNYKIALGLALGAAISFSPFVFTHIIQGCILAFFLRANYIAVAIGTLIGNPWTFPFMWWAGISLGAGIFNWLGFPASTNVPDAMSLEIFINLIKNDPFRILFPWMLGGYLICLVTLPLFYILFYQIVKGAKAARAIKRKKETQS